MSNTDKNIINTVVQNKGIIDTGVEGVDYINVSRYSKNKIGKKLAIGYPIQLDTIFGKIGSIRAGLDYLCIDGYPRELLSKKKLTYNEIKTIPKKRKSIPNYWSILIYILAKRIQSDIEIIDFIKANPNILFVSFNSYSESKFFDKDVKVSIINNKMDKYLSSIKLIADLIINNRFTEDNIKALIYAVRVDGTKEVFAETRNVEIKNI